MRLIVVFTFRFDTLPLILSFPYHPFALHKKDPRIQPLLLSFLLYHEQKLITNPLK